MNQDSSQTTGVALAPPGSPIIVVPYMWIGDFVRCHSVVKVLRARWPDRPVDLLTTTLCAPLCDYLPGVRQGIEWNLPRRRLPARAIPRAGQTAEGGRITARRW